MHWPDILLINLILFSGAFVQGIVGFGLGILCAPLVFMINPAMIPAPMIFNSIFLAWIIARDNRSQLNRAIVGWPILGSVAGSAVAAGFLFGIDERVFALVFATALLVLITLSFLRLRVAVTPANGFIAGLFSALSGTITAIGGPPIALYFQHLPPGAIRANLSIFFIASSVIGLVALAAIGKFTSSELALSAVTLPGVFLGFFSSRLIVKRIAPATVRYGVLGLSAVSGIALLVKHL